MNRYTNIKRLSKALITITRNTDRLTVPMADVAIDLIDMMKEIVVSGQHEPKGAIIEGEDEE